MWIEKRRIKATRNSSRGGSALELAFFLPWYVFLFIGVLDWGFYAHALISIQSAARVAALYTSSSALTAADTATACTLALSELRIAPNISSTLTTCNSLPVIVTATAVTGVDNQAASEVAVTYKTQPIIPIPGLLKGEQTFYRVVQMRLRS